MPATATIKGGRYRSAKQADGTWSIFDVPIFASCERTLTTPSGATVTLKVDRKWQEEAVAKAQAKAKNGYLSPLWVTHDTGKRDRLGFILPKRVEARPVGDHAEDATIADYVGLTETAVADFEAGKYPYVSAEVPVKSTREPVIHGAALLNERPFHEFPIQTVASGSAVSDPAQREGVFAFGATDETASVLARFSMPDDPNAPKPAAPVTDPAATPPAAPAKDPNAKPDGEGAMAAISTKLDAMLAALTKLLGGIATPDATKPPPVVAAAFSAEETTAKFTALETENADLKKRLDAKDAAEAKRVAVSGAVERLKGFDVGTDVTALCTAKFDAGGKVALDAFVDGRILAGDREPDAAWAAGEHKGDIDPLVAKFGAENADMIGALSQEYEGTAKVTSREAHVAVGLVRAKRITAAAAFGPAAK